MKMELVTHLGRSSYFVKNRFMEVFTTVLGGNTVAYFNIDGTIRCPYFIAPWWNESWLELGADLLNVCRGNFFCLPMGGDPDAFSGKVIPVHGNCANKNWMASEQNESALSQAIELIFHDDNGGSIHKCVAIREEERIVYEKNTVSGYTGKYPVAYHPMIQLPDRPGKAHLSTGATVDAYTTKEPHENPAFGGYYLFQNGVRITDLKNVPTIYGDFEDLTRQPIRQGFEEVVILVSDRQKNISYTAVTNFEDGYLYFQLKNPREFQSTMLWISNGGRHYAPWNGRTTSVIGLEETTSFFHYGLRQSSSSNFMSEQGYRTFQEFEKDKHYQFRLASGVIKIPPEFSGVETMEGSSTLFRTIC